MLRLKQGIGTVMCRCRETGCAGYRRRSDLLIGTRSRAISCEALAQVQRLTQNPALLAQVPSPGIPRARSERKVVSDGC